MRPHLFLHVFLVEARKLMGYRTDFWLTSLVSLAMQVAVFHCLWTGMLAGAGSGTVGGYSYLALMRYSVLAFLVGRLVVGGNKTSVLAGEIYQGTYTRYIIYPTGHFPFQYARHLGSLVPGGVQILLLAALAPFLLKGADPLPGTGLLLGALSIAVGNLLNFLIVYLIEGVAFWTDEVWSLLVMFSITGNLLGGFFLPLDLFPAWSQRLLAFTPFPYLYFMPIQALQGRLMPADWAQGLAVALGWCILLGLACRILWKKGNLRYTGVGI